MLQDEILRIEQYFRGIEYYNKAIIVKVMFPEKWQVFPSNDGKVKPAKADNGEYCYYGSSDDVTLDDIFALIKATIESNKHAEEKIAFLLAKRKELDDLFRNTPFEKLKTLTFEFKPQKKARKPRKKKEEETITISEAATHSPEELKQYIKEEPVTEEKSNAEETTIEKPIKRGRKKKEVNNGDS